MSDKLSLILEHSPRTSFWHSQILWARKLDRWPRQSICLSAPQHQCWELEWPGAFLTDTSGAWAGTVRQLKLHHLAYACCLNSLASFHYGVPKLARYLESSPGIWDRGSSQQGRNSGAPWLTSGSGFTSRLLCSIDGNVSPPRHEGYICMNFYICDFLMKKVSNLR